MNILLAIFASFVFIVAVGLLFVNFDKLTTNLTLTQKKAEDLKKRIKIAEDNRNFSEASNLKDELDNTYSGSIATVIVAAGGCLIYLILGIGHTISELILMIWALAAKVGDPTYGYIALAVYVVVNLYNIFIAPKILASEKAKAEAVGNTYLPKTSLFQKIVMFVPDLYALYVLLVIIGIISSVAA